MKRAPKHSARPKATPPQPISEQPSVVWDLKPKKGRDAYKSWLRATFPRLAQLAMIFLPKNSSWEIILGRDDLLVLSLVESIKRFKSYAESLSGDDLNETLRSASVAAESISDDSGGQSLPHLLANHDKLFKSAKKNFHRLITTLFELLIEEIKGVAGDIEIDKEITALHNAWELRIAALCAKKPAVQSFTEEDILFPFQRIAEKLSAPFDPAGKLRGPQSIKKLAEISAQCGGSHDRVFSIYLQGNARGRRKTTEYTLNNWNKDCTTADLDDSGVSRYAKNGASAKITLGSPFDTGTEIIITNENGHVRYDLLEKTYHITDKRAVAFIDLLIEANKSADGNHSIIKPIPLTKDGQPRSRSQFFNFVFSNSSKISPFKAAEFWHDHIIAKGNGYVYLGINK